MVLKAGFLLLGLFAGSALSPEESLLLDRISASGRCTGLGDLSDDRVSRPQLITAGPPPLLSFRYYEGKSHHGFGNADLMLDDAGH